MQKSLVITIDENGDGDFDYEIYATQEDLEMGNDSLDGGTCTSTIENALEMAFEQSKELLKTLKK